MANYFHIGEIKFLCDDDVWIRIQDIDNLTPEIRTVINQCSNVFWLVDVFHSYGGFDMDIGNQHLLRLLESNCSIVTEKMREEARQALMGYPDKPHIKPKPAPRKKYKGHIYVIQKDGYYKIGRTIRLERRLKELSALSPTPLNLICTIPSDDLLTDEENTHAKFDSKRVSNEWFELTAQDVTWLKQQGETT